VRGTSVAGRSGTHSCRHVSAHHEQSAHQMQQGGIWRADGIWCAET